MTLIWLLLLLACRLTTATTRFFQDPKFQELKPLLQNFHKQFLADTTTSTNPSLFVDQSDVSCGSWDSSRSLFQQHDQIKQLVPTEMQERAEANDQTAIRAILDEHVFPFADPCVPATCKKMGSAWIPPTDGSFTFTVSVPALNGWIFQNHYDCAAVAMAGGVNAAFGFNRTDPLLTSRDAVAVVKNMETWNIMSAMEEIEPKIRKEELEKVKQTLQEALHPEGKTGVLKFRGNTEDHDWRVWRNKVLEGFSADTQTALRSAELWVPLNRLRQLRKLNSQTSTSDWAAGIRMMGLGADAQWVTEYSFEDVERWLSTPGVAVLVHLPMHLGMVFAAGKNKNGQYRHVVVGRPSGGQSPCGWIPFTFDDAAENEKDFWEGDTIGQGFKSLADRTALTMQHMTGQQRRLILITRGSSVGQLAVELNNQPIPEWLQDPKKFCGMCVGATNRGDSWEREAELGTWLALDERNQKCEADHAS